MDRGYVSLLCAICVLCTVGCKPKVTVRGAPATVIHGRYFRVLSVKQEQDAEHPERISEVDRTTWYCDPTPGVDLLKCDVGKAFVQGDVKNGFLIMMPIATAHKEEVGQWFRSHIGEFVGITLGNDLVWVAKIEGWTGYVAIGGFSSYEEADRKCAVLNGGGLPTE